MSASLASIGIDPVEHGTVTVREDHCHEDPSTWVTVRERAGGAIELAVFEHGIEAVVAALREAFAWRFPDPADTPLPVLLVTEPTRDGTPHDELRGLVDVVRMKDYFAWQIFHGMLDVLERGQVRDYGEDMVFTIDVPITLTS